MTFLHKLSKRLAHSRVGPVIGLAAIFACEIPSRPREPNESSASRLALSPKLVTLQQYQIADFTAVAFTGAGDTADVAISWSASSGSVTGTSTNSGRHNGRYRAGSDTGKVKVVAKGDSGGIADTAIVTVTLAPVAVVTVNPAAASVSVGQTTQLATTLQDASGNALSGRAIIWATGDAAVATVSGGGLVTGASAGTATITATSEGQSGTATVTVTAVPPPPPTPPGTVTDLTVASVTENSVTLSFTEVSDGAGQPASYDIRYAAGPISWGSAASVTQGTCATPVAGAVIGSVRTCTVLGLASSTACQFQLIAFRGTLNVNAVYGGVSNVASGTTATSTAPVATVTVSPAGVSLAVGGTQQLTATLRDASGKLLTGRQISWASSNILVGTVNGTGLVTALAAGVATITATSEGQSGTSALTVTILPTGGSNEPADFTPVSDRSFGALTELGWGASALLALVPDAGAPQSAPSVGQVTYPAGFGGGYDPAFTWLAGVAGRGYTRLYVSFWVKLSSNWQGHSSGVNKIGFVWLHNDPVVYFSAQGSGSGRLEAQVRLQNIPGAGARNLTPNLTNPEYTRGQWHHWEVVLVVNTGDQANGEAHWWLDGTKVGEYTDILYGSSGQGKVWGDEVSWKPIWGGAGDVVSQTMYMWMDHYYISGR